MINSLKTVDLKLQEFNFDFQENKKTVFNADVYSDRIKGSLGFILNDMPFAESSQITELKYFDGVLYVTLNDGYIYYYDGGLIKLCDVKLYNRFNIGYVDYKGKKCLAIISTFKSVLISDGECLQMPFNSIDFQYAFGRIFYVVNETIYFTKPYDYFSGPEGAIKLDSLNGFRKLYLIHDELYVICKNSISKISRFASPDDLKLEVVPVNVENVSPNLIFGIGDFVYFMQERDMCKFDGKTIKTFTTCIPSPEYIMFTTESGAYKNGINLRVKKNDERGNLLYRYDTVNETETLIDYTGKLFAGYSSCVASNGDLMSLDKQGKRDVVYRSKDTDFSIMKNKRTYSICGYASTEANVTLIGDFGEKTFSFKKGYNEVFCNLESLSFKVTITSNSEDFLIQGLKIKFTTID